MLHTKKPRWLKKPLPKGKGYQQVRNLVQDENLHTVCQQAGCPNIYECFQKKTSTFLIGGNYCTRTCRFCNITSQHPDPLDPDEPGRVAKAVNELGLGYAVITSVTRDDLEDGGAAHFAATIEAIRMLKPVPLIEVLIPDFNGQLQSLETVLNAGPTVLNHNIETVPQRYSHVRPKADFNQSLDLLSNCKKILPGIVTKSGIMVGLGETVSQLEKTMIKLYEVNCDILTIGQYLQPGKANMGVEKFYTPEAFSDLKKMAEDIGFNAVASGPFVRSSYQAASLYASVS